jgi:uncharacterized membrane protein YukC
MNQSAMNIFKTVAVLEIVMIVLLLGYVIWIHLWVISHCNAWLAAYKERTLYWSQGERSDR